MGDRLRAAVIGVGSMGRNHTRIYSSMDGIELIGVADSNQNVAENIAYSYSCPAFTDYQNLLDQNLDLVTIAVPTTMHFTVAREAIKRNINVLIEKPVTQTIEQANALIELSNLYDARVMVGHIERFNPPVGELKRLIDGGELGTIISLSAKRVGPHNPRIRDVGIILDLGVHDIDVMSYLYGKKITSIYSVFGKVAHPHEDYAIITLRFGDGASGVIETNWLTPHKMRTLSVVGSLGIAELDYQNATLKIYDEKWTKEVKITKEEPLKREIEYFVNCIINRINPSVGLQEGRHALEVALMAIESAKKGMVYDLATENLAASGR